MKQTRCRADSRLIILFIVVGMLVGCASIFQNLDDRVGRKRFKSDYQALDKAMAAYDAGKFETALDQFKTLASESASETVSRRAWLGEICCRLMVADSKSAYANAIGMWHEFAESQTDQDSRWNLTLLDPFIIRQATPPPPPPPPPQKILVPVPVDPPKSQTGQPVAKQPQPIKQDEQRLQAELAAMKIKAEQLDDLQEQLDQVVAENRSLKEKIKALEAIDQSIQKKKTEISTPSE